MKYLWGITGGSLLFYFFSVNFLGGRTYFSEIFLITGIIAMGIFFMYDKIMGISFIKNNIAVIKVVLILALSIFMIVEAIIILYPKKNMEESDVVIVLGAGLKGKDLSLTLRDRLDVTLEYISSTNYEGKIIVSGGQGPDEDISEAEAMKEYLVGKGISREKIIMENKSTSTSENLKFSRNVIIENLDMKPENISTTIITTDFHGMRSYMLAKRNNYGEVRLYTSNTQWYLIPNMYVREFFAFIKSVAFDR